MFNGEYTTPTPREDPSPSNLRSQATNTTPNGLSASGAGPASGFQLASDGTQIDFSRMGPQHLMTPLMGSFQHQLLQGNPGGVYNAGPSSHGPNLSNATATGGGNVPIMPYGGPPPTLPNVPNGHAGTGNPSASFQVADQPPTRTWYDIHPEVFTTPNAQGIPASGPFWRLIYAALDYEGGDDLRVVIHFRKIRSP